MLRVRNLRLDTHSERVFVLHERAVAEGRQGFKPLDRIELVAEHAGRRCVITGVLNFCKDRIVEPDEIGLSEVAFADLGVPEGTPVEAYMARSPESLDAVRRKLAGGRLQRADFDAILGDVVAHRYSKVELSMFVLACGLQRLAADELIAFTRAMVDCGSRLEFAGDRPVADKHSIGGVPGNRTTLIVVPILAALGVRIPKTSSRAITSPAGTADTMSEFAEVSLAPERMREIVEKHGGCIAWGGSLDLAPADDILITVERPMEIDTEAQMVASILAKKKTAGASHVLIDLPVGETAKVRSEEQARALADSFRDVGRALDLHVQVVVTEARAPIGRGIGPRLEALDVLAVLRRDPDAPTSLREKSLYLAAQLLEQVGAVAPAEGYRSAQQALDSGAALARFEAIVGAQGAREPSPPAAHVARVPAERDGRIRAIDCFGMSKIAKRAGAPAQPAAGVWGLRGVGDIVTRGEPLFEVHAQTRSQLQFALEFAAGAELFHYGY